MSPEKILQGAEEGIITSQFPVHEIHSDGKTSLTVLNIEGHAAYIKKTLSKEPHQQEAILYCSDKKAQLLNEKFGIIFQQPNPQKPL